MAMRTASRSRASGAAPISIDLVLLTCRERRLCVLADSASGGRSGPIALPWGHPERGEQLDATAVRIATKAAGATPGWIEQAGAFADGTDHPGGALLSVCYVGLVPWRDGDATWLKTLPIPGLADRHRRMVIGAIGAVRTRLEQAPIAFSLLPREFTLTELQVTYETVLARRLHKASFRRSLQAAFLVQPTGHWRGEGPGRPAQLYRYAPRRRKAIRRGVRLDLL
jgi:8-oxo-dGTP diphosphatase